MKTLTVISNFNEEGSILQTIQDFRSHKQIDSDLLVIDNWSYDRSYDLIKNSGEKYLRHAVNTGSCSSVIKTSFLYSYLNHYDIYCNMDGDNQHNASELKTLIQPILDGKADIVIGSRFINKKGFQSFFVRRIGINLFSKAVSWLSGQEVTDITSGFRAYNRKAIEYFANQYKHEYEHCAQMLIVVAYANLRVQEVPVLMNPRTSGKSMFNPLSSMKFVIYGIISMIGTRLQKKQIKRNIA
jgi:glycosyltransferase involved in cell wall biosynthesis